MSAPDVLVWIDLEMTGLDVSREQILEIATIVTDAELRIIAGAGHQLRHDPRAVAVLLGWLDRQANAET